MTNPWQLLAIRTKAMIRSSDALSSLYFKARSWASQRQGAAKADFFGYTVSLPERHPLLGMFSSGPRDSLLIAISRNCFESKLNHYVDVGANIGDSALIIERHADTSLESDLVEPSGFFFNFLVKNSRLLKAPTLHKKFASVSFPPESIRGILYHWPGNAEIVDLGDDVIAEVLDQVNLADIVRHNTALVKVDCEGLDVQILNAAESKGMKGSPVLYFECTLRSQEDISSLKLLIESISDRYDRAMMTDPSGLLIYSGSLDMNFWTMHRYQVSLGKLRRQESLYYVDVALFPKSRTEIFEKCLEELSREFTWPAPRP